METKRVSISSELYANLYNAYISEHGNKFQKKGDSVVAQINNILSEYNTLIEKDCVELDEETKKRVDMLIKLNISNDAEDVLRESIKHYLNTKKEEIKKLVDEL